MVMTWQNGRQLATLQKGTDAVSYTYDADGLRTSKTVNGQTTQYFWDDRGVMYRQQAADGKYTWFYAGLDGSIGTLNYNGTSYSLLKNLQGDVIGIANTSGNLVAQYTYGAWGNILSITDGSGNDVSNNPNHIANINPIRYRGYYYDTETGFYYLRSRYYDPEMCRFINADGFVSTGQKLLGINMFAYCQNNPTNYIDIDGFFIGTFLGGAIGAIGGLIAGGVSAAIKGEDILNGMASGAIGGAVGGAIAGAVVDTFTILAPAAPVVAVAAVGAIGGAAGGVASSTISQSSNYYLNNGSMNGFQMDWRAVGTSASFGAIFNGLGAGFGASLVKYYDDALVGAFGGAIWSMGNALADFSNALASALTEVTDALLGKTCNSYHYTASDYIKLKTMQIALEKGYIR